MVRHDSLAKKVIVICQCLAQMKTCKYRVVLMLNEQGDIIHGSCACPAGAGPSCSCKHLAALCYTLEDFVKTFVLPEDIPSCTDRLESWNKPREAKLPTVPVWDIDFQRKRYGRQRKQERPLKGNPPDSYGFQSICEAEQTAASTFLAELQEWTNVSSVGLLINTVASADDPVEIGTVNPLYTYTTAFKNNLDQVCKAESKQKIQDLKQCLKVSDAQQALIREHTLLQSRNSDWFFLRKFRKAGSLVGRVCNYYKYKRSDPQKIANAILEPSSFTSAAIKYGLELEPAILERYKADKVKDGINMSLKKLGLIVDSNHGFIAASPDSGVVENGSLTGIVECKSTVKYSLKTVSECATDPGYPFQTVKQYLNGTTLKIIRLKPNHAWYNQIHLQLYVCRGFAKYCDLALLHPDSGSFHCERFELCDEWVAKCIPQFEEFFCRFMAPKIIDKFK